jgi:hypothetical protein
MNSLDLDGEPHIINDYMIKGLYGEGYHHLLGFKPNRLEDGRFVNQYYVLDYL